MNCESTMTLMRLISLTALMSIYFFNLLARHFDKILYSVVNKANGLQFFNKDKSPFLGSKESDM